MKNPTATEEKCVYTVADIQARLGIGRRQAYNLVNEKRFPHKNLGKTKIIPKKDFDEWLTNGSMYNIMTCNF